MRVGVLVCACLYLCVCMHTCIVFLGCQVHMSCLDERSSARVSCTVHEHVEAESKD